MKERFNTLLSSISRSGADLEGLKECLAYYGFYSAPASTKYHSSFSGGLCQHSLIVYDLLKKLTDQYCPGMYPEDTIRIVGLLHDIAKSNYYVEEIKNRKVYRNDGSKMDSVGRYDWESYTGYSINGPENRNLLGTLEENSYYIVSQYIPLTLEESSALLNHCGGVEGSSSSMNRDLSAIFRRYPLVSLLHMADFLASYIVEKEDVPVYE